MSALTLDRLFALLEDYVQRTGRRLDVLPIGRLALYAYGSLEVRTEAVDAELDQDVEEVGALLKQHGIPSNVRKNISSGGAVRHAASTGYLTNEGMD